MEPRSGRAGFSFGSSRARDAVTFTGSALVLLGLRECTFRSDNATTGFLAA